MTVPVTDGFVVVTGRNGSGKSTLIDAIEFALTGEISRPALSPENREALGNYIWWRGTGKPADRVVRLAFDLENGQRLTVARRPDSVVFQVLDGDRSSRPTEAELRSYFATPSAPSGSLLPRLCGTAIIRDEQITELSVDAPEATRFSLVRDTLGSTYLPGIEERLKRAQNTIDHRIGTRTKAYDEARTDVTRLVAQVSEARSEFDAEPDLEVTRRELASALDVGEDTEPDALLREARSRIGKLRRFVATLAACTPRLRELEGRRTEVETEGYRAEGQELKERLDRATEYHGQTVEELRAAEDALAQFEGRRAQIRALGELVAHGRRLGLDEGRCPLCGNTIGQDSFDLAIREAGVRIEAESKGLSDALSRREEALREEQRSDSRRRKVEDALREHSRAGEELRAGIAALANEIREVGGFPTPQLNAGALEEAAVAARATLAPIEEAVTKLEMSAAYERLVEQQRAVSDARERLTNAQRLLEAAQRAGSQQAEASRAVRRLAGELVDQRLAQLEPLLLELYQRLRPHVQWPTVGYRVRGDVRRFMRLTVGEGELNPRFMFSSGQRRALGLAFLLAVHLSTTWSRWNTLVLDDPMQHVDDYRALHLVEVLGSIRRSGRQVLCAVEDASLASLLTRRLATSETETGSIVHLAYEVGTGSTVVTKQTLQPLARRLVVAA